MLGTTDPGLRHFGKRARAGVEAFRARLAKNADEAAAFVERFGVESPQAARALSTLPTCGWMERRFRIVRHGLFKQGLLRNLSLLLFA